MKRGKGAKGIDIETTLYLNDQDVVIEAKGCGGYYDPGCTYGPIERCYPPEVSFEVEGSIKIYTDDKDKKSIDYKSLSGADQDIVKDAIEAAFWDNFCPDYDQDDIGD